MDGDGDAALSSAPRVNDRNAIDGRRDASVTTKRTPSQRQPRATHSLTASSIVWSVTIDSSTIL